MIFVIMTDGMENSSHEFTKSQVKEMIQEQQSKYNWHFTFLGSRSGRVCRSSGNRYRRRLRGPVLKRKGRFGLPRYLVESQSDAKTGNGRRNRSQRIYRSRTQRDEIVSVCQVGINLLTVPDQPF